MSEKGIEKSGSPFDSDSNDETIALSKDELDDILSEAEIVQETSSEAFEGEKELSFQEGEAQNFPEESIETQEGVELEEAEEFDISDEIDELSPEDLEDIELEDEEIEAYTKELETELGEDFSIPEGEEGEKEEDFEKELEGVDTEGLTLEANLDEEMDLDSYLERAEADLDLDSIELEEGEKEDLAETFVEEEETETEKAFKEAGIEGTEEEFLPLEGNETAKEVEIEEEKQPTEEIQEEELYEMPVIEEEQPVEAVNTVIEEPYETESELSLTEEEEAILDEDLDLEKEAHEEAEAEDFVSMTGEELDRLSTEEAERVKVEEMELPEPESLEKEIKIEEPEATQEGVSVDRELLNNISKVLKYMDSLLGDLPEDKIKEFAKSEYFPIYKEVFKKLNIA